MRDSKIKPLISVIVPIYNGENYVEMCVESILSQTYTNLEIILVDDGSKDMSGRLCDMYADKDTRVRVIHKKNGGLVSARKTGICEAKGYYAAYVDGDDWLELNMYEQLIEEIGDADVVVSRMIRNYSDYAVYEKNKIPDGIYEGERLRREVHQRMIYSGDFFEKGLLMHVCTSLYKRELLLENQIQVPEKIQVGEDAACLYPVLLNANKIVIVSESYYHYRIREGSIMGMNRKDDLRQLRVFYNYMKCRFSEKTDLKDNLEAQLEYLMIYFILLRNMKLLQKQEGLFPYVGISKKDKLVVYGKGRFGKELINFAKDRYLITGWIDNCKNIENLNKLINLDYDYIVIAVLIKEIADEIVDELMNVGITADKIKRIDRIEIEKGRKSLKYILS